MLRVRRASGGRTGLLVAGTSLRIVLTPVVMALVLSEADTAAAIVFAAGAATDWFDGRRARGARGRGSGLPLARDGDCRSRARSPRPESGGRVGGSAFGGIAARQMEGDRAVLRDHPRDSAAGRDHRRGIPG